MVGFIKGIFGAKQTAKTESVKAPEAAPKPPKPEKKLQTPKPQKQVSQAFYLDTADAQTLGDIDYMKAAREIRRSFPKRMGEEELRTVSVVSSLQRSQAQKAQTVAQQRSQAAVKLSATFAPQSTTASGWATSRADNLPKLRDPKERRRDDSTLDSFRTMARDIQKSNARK